MSYAARNVIESGSVSPSPSLMFSPTGTSGHGRDSTVLGCGWGSDRLAGTGSRVRGVVDTASSTLPTIPLCDSLLLSHRPSLPWPAQISQSMVYIELLVLYSTIIGLPWRIYLTFVLEERHGFNKQVWPHVSR